jgi:hypothetical protein
MSSSHHLQSLFALLFFSLWLLGILAMQINIVYGLAAGRNLHWLTFWSRWDVLHICPNFAFFSRLPIVHYHILIRDHLLDHEFAAWRLIVLPKRSIMNTLWNPGRRRRFGIEDACRSLITHLREELEMGKGGDPVCLAFLCLLNYAAAQPRSPFVCARQFMIATVPSLGARGSTPIFVSPLFLLDLDSPMERRSEIKGESLAA